jgi:hypothetical protein
VLDRDAEAECSHCRGLGYDTLDRREQLGDARLVTGDHAVQVPEPVAPSLPVQI